MALLFYGVKGLAYALCTEMGAVRKGDKEMWGMRGGSSKGMGRKQSQPHIPSKICILTSSDLSGREQIFRFR